jgi:AcrR family transcriptional regulator
MRWATSSPTSSPPSSSAAEAVTHATATPLPQRRSVRGRDAVLDAAGELLVTRGLTAVTIDAVAQRAHVEATAISRWWPTEEALAVDVLYHEWVALAGHVRREACRFGL